MKHGSTPKGHRLCSFSFYDHDFNERRSSCSVGEFGRIVWLAQVLAVRYTSDYLLWHLWVISGTGQCQCFLCL